MALYLKDKTSNGYDLTVSAGTVAETTSVIPTVAGNVAAADFSTSSTLLCDDDFTNIDTSDFTIELWLKQKAAAGDRILFNKNGTDGQIYIQDSDTIVTQINGTSQTSSNTLTSTNWIHLAFVYDRAAGTIKIYKDGVLDETITSQSTNGIPNNASAFSIQAPAANGFYIDEYRIWNDQRTITEINNNKAIRLVGNEAGLVAYYQFELDQPGAAALMMAL